MCKQKYNGYFGLLDIDFFNLYCIPEKLKYHGEELELNSILYSIMLDTSKHIVFLKA